MGINFKTLNTNPYGWLELPGASGDFAHTPDTAAVSVVGDLDIRVHVALDDWSPAAAQYFASKRDGASDRSWHFSIGTTGLLGLTWSEDGSAVISKVSTVALSTISAGAELHVRVTLDVDAGSTDNDVTFYTSSDGVSWDQLGAVVNTAGITSIFDSGALLTVGATGNSGTSPVSGQIFSAQVYDGIGGTLAADFNPSRDPLVGATVTSSSTGEAWTIAGNAVIKSQVADSGTYDQGRGGWYGSVAEGQHAKLSMGVDPGNTGYGIGGTWLVAVVGPRDPGTGLTPEEAIDPNIVALFTEVSSVGLVSVSYEFSDSTPPTGYDVIVVTDETVDADLSSWGPLGALTTPTIHARSESWLTSDASDAARVSDDSITIDAKTNAAFDIPGVPGVVNFGDGGTVTAGNNLPANLATGLIVVGEDDDSTGVHIGAIPSGSTYPDSTVSTRKHVIWGFSLNDVDSYHSTVWQTMANAILWLRS